MKLHPAHFRELVEGSAIDPALASANFETFEDTALVARRLNRRHHAPSLDNLSRGDLVRVKDSPLTWQYQGTRLEGSPKYGYKERILLARPGSPKAVFIVPRSSLESVATADRGGVSAPAWVGSGLDPLNDWRPSEFCCLKPDAPRLGDDGKPRKYEHPAGKPLSAFFLDVPALLWEKISQRSGVPITPADRLLGFWPWVCRNKTIQIILCEGIKKAASLLSAGFVAVGLPGINSGHRSPKNDDGVRTGASYLIPELEVLDLDTRPVSICFDKDTKAKTIKAVQQATRTLGHLLKKAKAAVSVIQWNQAAKGCDDLIVGYGPESFSAAAAAALPFDVWTGLQHATLTYEPKLIVNQRYISQPEASGLVCIKSAKGTGKTESLIPLATENQRAGVPTYVLTHRVQLGRAITDRVGLPWVEDLADFEQGTLLGYGLCIDSLHPNSQARFNPENCHGATLIIDEAEQVIGHLLTAATCEAERIAIMRTFTDIVQIILSSGGKIVLQDADLSDVTIDLILTLYPAVEPWVMVNEWKPTAPARYVALNGSSPAPVLKKACDLIEAGQRLILVTDSQQEKAKWGTINLESYLAEKKPTLRILRIDSQTVADPTHPAYGCAERLNDIATGYDVIIASPSIGTGVSIDIKGHFSAVLGIFQGAITPSDARQFMARLREPVTRYFWAPTYSAIGKLGDGSTSYKALKSFATKRTQLGARLLDLDYEDEPDYNPGTAYLETWGKIAARTNAAKTHYRAALIAGLKAEGQTVEAGELPTKDELEPINEGITATRDTAIEDYCQTRAAAAPSATQPEAEQLADQRSKTPDQRATADKDRLIARYGVEITPALVKADLVGMHPKWRLHYYLTHNPEYLKKRDREHFKGHRERGQGHLWHPDLKLFTPLVKLLQLLNVPALLTAGREFSNLDPELVNLANTLKQHPNDVRLVRLKISEADTPILVLRKLLFPMGLALTFTRRAGPRKQETRFYKISGLEDGRLPIFERWDSADRAKLENVSSCDTVATSPYIYIKSAVATVATGQPEKTPATIARVTASENSEYPAGGNNAPGKLASFADTAKPTAPQLPAVALMARSSSLAISPIGETTRVTSPTNPTNSPQLPSWRSPAKGEAKGRRVWVAGRVLPVIFTAGDFVTVATGLHRLEDVLLIPLEDPRGKPLTYGLGVA